MMLLSMWSWPTADGSIPICRLTVKAATDILMGKQVGARLDGQLQFCQLARRLAAVAPSSQSAAESTAPALAVPSLQRY